MVTGLADDFQHGQVHSNACGRPQPTMQRILHGLEGHKLEKCHDEKDLGVLVTDDLKVESQCNQAFSKANRMLGILKRNIVNKTPRIMINLYKTLIRPHVEYCVSAWTPHYAKDKKTLERIQHRFTKLIPGLQRLTYAERLEKLGLWTLEERRNRADLIEVFKMANNLSPIPLSSYFELNIDGRTRGHSLKLVKHRCKTEIRPHFFSERVINRLQYAGAGHGISEDSKRFQVKAGKRKIKEDGPVSRLKSARPRGRLLWKEWPDL